MKLKNLKIRVRCAVKFRTGDWQVTVWWLTIAELARHSSFGHLEKLVIFVGHAVAQLVEALPYKPGGRVFDSRWCN
jgi:hypothetical protein